MWYMKNSFAFRGLIFASVYPHSSSFKQVDTCTSEKIISVEVAGVSGRQVGVILSVREIPGFLALLAVYIMLIIPEHRLSALSIVLLGAGAAAAGFYPSYIGLLTTTLVMSFGFHYYETTNQSLTLPSIPILGIFFFPPPYSSKNLFAFQ
jgi:hypothetical protein